MDIYAECGQGVQYFMCKDRALTDSDDLAIKRDTPPSPPLPRHPSYATPPTPLCVIRI